VGIPKLALQTHRFAAQSHWGPLSDQPQYKENRMFKRILAGALAVVTTLSMAAVDVNKATVADLDSIKGIGPGTSAKVLKAREQAAFKDWADLIQRVGGIGPKKAAQLSDNGLTVNGQTYGGAVTPAPVKP
jgi:competence protein ComEA